MGTLFFPFSSPPPFQKKKGKNTGLWEWLNMGVSMGEAAIGRMKIE